MPFRRKCEDELPPKRVVVPYARGEIGPFRPLLAGYREGYPVAFGDADPEGAEYLTIARQKREAALRETRKRKRKELDAKRDPSDYAILEATEAWWDDVG